MGAIVLGGHVQGLGIIRSLGRNGISVFLVDETSGNIGRFSKYCSRFFKLPKMKQEESLVPFLIKLSKKEKMKDWVLFPTHDATVEIVSKNREILQQYYRISVPEWEITELAYNKIPTYKIAKKIGIPIPQTFFPSDKDDLRRIAGTIVYPVIIKPAIMHKFYSKTRTKVFKAISRQDLEDKYTKACSIIAPSEIMIQEIIPGEPENLFSCGCFFKEGTIVGSCTGQRNRQIPMDFGKATTYVQSVEIPELKDHAENLLSAIGYYGLAEVEFKRDPRDGIFKLLEINARAWKWHTIAIKAGIDIPNMIYNDLTGRPTESNGIYKVGVKWIELCSDVYVALTEIVKRKLTVKEYFNSLKGELEFAIASKDDPMPFVCYIFLIPYLIFSR